MNEVVTQDYFVNTIIRWVQDDKLRMAAIKAVHSLNISECYIAAGFVRNLVWDNLHGYTTSTPFNDIDVIYFCVNQDEEHDKFITSLLKTELPQLNWQVKNQAFMHLINGDKPYKSVIDAMSYWPEKETALAIKMNSNKQLHFVHAFNLDSLFALNITANPKRDKEIFLQRIKTKKWLEQWPRLTISNTSL